jgi:Tfp pilus assembly protein FimT
VSNQTEAQASTEKESSSVMDQVSAAWLFLVFFAIAYQAFTHFVAVNRTRGAGLGLQAAMLDARAEAMKRKTDVTLSQVVGGWEFGWRIVDPRRVVLREEKAPSGIAITGAPVEIVFGSDGRIKGDAAPSFLVTSTAFPAVRRCLSSDIEGRSSIKTKNC